MLPSYCFLVDVPITYIFWDRTWKDFVVPPEPLEDEPDTVVSPEAWDVIVRLLEEPQIRLGNVSYCRLHLMDLLKVNSIA